MQVAFAPPGPPAAWIFGVPAGRAVELSLLDLGGNPAAGSPWVHIRVLPPPGVPPAGAGSPSLACASGDGGGCPAGVCSAYAVPGSGRVAFAACSILGTAAGAHTLLASTVRSGAPVYDRAYSPLADPQGNVAPAGALNHQSPPFPVTGPPAALLLDTLAPPAAAAAGIVTRLTPPPAVRVIDAAGATVAAFAGPVAVRLDGPGGPGQTARLAGATVVQAAGGVAAFDGLAFAGAGGNYTLTFAVAAADPAAGTTAPAYQAPVTFLPGPPCALVPLPLAPAAAEAAAAANAASAAANAASAAAAAAAAAGPTSRNSSAAGGNGTAANGTAPQANRSAASAGAGAGDGGGANQPINASVEAGVPVTLFFQARECRETEREAEREIEGERESE